MDPLNQGEFNNEKTMRKMPVSHLDKLLPTIAPQLTNQLAAMKKIDRLVSHKLMYAGIMLTPGDKAGHGSKSAWNVDMRARYDQVGRPSARLAFDKKGRIDWLRAEVNDETLASHRYTHLLLRTPTPVKVVCAHRVGANRRSDSGPSGSRVPSGLLGDLSIALHITP